MLDRAGTGIDGLSARDLCDLAEYRLFEHASAKERKKLASRLAAAGRAYERRWAADHPLPFSAVAQFISPRVRVLPQPLPDGMAVGHSSKVDD